MSGLGAGLSVALTAMWLDDYRVGWVAMVLTPVTGLLYLGTVNRLVPCLRRQPPPSLSGAVVGGGVAGLFGIAVWAFVGTFSSTVTGSATEAVRVAWNMLGEAVTGGMLGGFTAGAIVAALGMRWPAEL
jgi:hypothetical protein